MQIAAPEVVDISQRDRGHPKTVRSGRPRSPRLRPPLPARPPHGRARRALRSALLRRHQRLGRATATSTANHSKLCAQSDQPIAGLLTDLKSRGLLESTLVIWGGEFGRMPMSEGGNGRDHNPHGFYHLDGRRRRQGRAGHRRHRRRRPPRGRERTHVHDLHATILHLLGLDHTRLTYPSTTVAPSGSPTWREM